MKQGILDQSVDLRHLPKTSRQFIFTATQAERETLQSLLQVRVVNSVETTLVVERLGARGGIQLSGSVSADIVQACVVTLGDVHSQPKADFTVRFVKEAQSDQKQAADIDPEEDDIEYFSGDFIDLTEVVVQYLSLEIDPYPRVNTVSEEAEFVYSTASGKDLDVEEKPHPFAELKKLQDKT